MQSLRGRQQKDEPLKVTCLMLKKAGTVVSPKERGITEISSIWYPTCCDYCIPETEVRGNKIKEIFCGGKLFKLVLKTKTSPSDFPRILSHILYAVRYKFWWPLRYLGEKWDKQTRKEEEERRKKSRRFSCPYMGYNSQLCSGSLKYCSLLLLQWTLPPKEASLYHV